jgi:Ca2+-binding RTX toxin-like protein
VENIIFNNVNDDPPQELVKALEGDHLIGGLLDDMYNDDCIIMDPVFLTAPGIYSFSANGDRVNGSSSHDFIMTLGCSDRVWGNGGNDVIIGGHGSDILYGGAGNDRIYTGHADYLDSSWDPLEGHIDVELELHDSFSFDRVYAGEGDDFVMGDFGVDVIHGGDGDDILYG